MAPSRQHSTKIDASHLPSPVKQIVSFQSCLITSTQTHDNDSDTETMVLHPSQDPHAISAPATHLSDDDSDILPLAPVPSLTQLIPQPSTHCTPPQPPRGMFSGSSAEFLVNNMPIQSSFRVPDPIYSTMPIMPAPARETLLSKSKFCMKANLLIENKLQQQELEVCCQELEVHRNALRESSTTVDVLNAQLALSNMTYVKAHQQLASQEDKHAAPKRKEISMVLGHVLTHESFLDAQLKIDQHQGDAEEAKKMKEQLEKDWKKYEEEYNEGVKMWKAKVEQRKAAGEKGHLLKPKKMTKKVWLAAHIEMVGEDIAMDVLGNVGGDMDDKDGDI